MKGGRNSCRMLSGFGNGLSTDGTGPAHEELSAKVTPKLELRFPALLSAPHRACSAVAYTGSGGRDGGERCGEAG